MWCPRCKNKTEDKVHKELLKLFPNIDIQKTFANCKNINLLRFDFCIELLKIIIELDGRQHFTNVKCFRTSCDENRKRDVYKMKCALKEGYSIVRIVQEDVLKDKYDWLDGLKNIFENAPYITPTVFYEDENGIYSNHKNDMEILENDINEDDITFIN